MYLCIIQSFPYENHCTANVTKKQVSRLWPVLFTIIYFFLIHTPSSSAEK